MSVRKDISEISNWRPMISTISIATESRICKKGWKVNSRKLTTCRLEISKRKRLQWAYMDQQQRREKGGSLIRQRLPMIWHSQANKNKQNRLYKSSKRKRKRCLRGSLDVAPKELEVEPKEAWPHN